MFKSFKDFDGLAIHIDTFKEYLNTLPANNGWVHFAIFDLPATERFPKQMTVESSPKFIREMCAQLDATPREMGDYVKAVPGIEVKEWIEAKRRIADEKL